jgi:hypothetical protein
MIIVRIMGGLGNQLFQYAAALGFSVRRRTKLKLDIGFFESSNLRSYGLNHFCLSEQEFATPGEIAALTWIPRRNITNAAVRVFQRPLRLIEPHLHRSVFLERRMRPYNPNILMTPRDVYLDGYWQSERYFSDIEEVIRREFTIKDQMDAANQQTAEAISKADSVSVHVRRGDAVSDPGKNRIFGTCSLEYYEKCAAMVAEKVGGPHFFVFSDDPGWTATNLHFRHPTTYVTQNDASKNYEDLRLMSLCQHNIIANSTLSWWGAWLNSNPDKLVLAPKKWFNDPSFDTRDLIPASWIKV